MPEEINDGQVKCKMLNTYDCSVNGMLCHGSESCPFAPSYSHQFAVTHMNNVVSG
jgi:hypothetical protein